MVITGEVERLVGVSQLLACQCRGHCDLGNKEKVLASPAAHTFRHRTSDGSELRHIAWRHGGNPNECVNRASRRVSAKNPFGVLFSAAALVEFSAESVLDVAYSLSGSPRSNHSFLVNGLAFIAWNGLASPAKKPGSNSPSAG